MRSQNFFKKKKTETHFFFGGQKLKTKYPKPKPKIPNLYLDHFPSLTLGLSPTTKAIVNGSKGNSNGTFLGLSLWLDWSLSLSVCHSISLYSPFLSS